jgi:hypothetical protein
MRAKDELGRSSKQEAARYLESYGFDPRPSAFQAGRIPSWRGSFESYALSLVTDVRRWLLLLLSRLLSTRHRPSGSTLARTLQGMAHVRSGQASAWPLSSDRSVRRGSSVKRDFACTFSRASSTCARCPAVTVTLDAGGAGTDTQRAIPGTEPGHTSSQALVIEVDLTVGRWCQARVGYRSYSRHMISFERDSIHHSNAGSIPGGQ